jgi:type IV secretory pathway VirB10-like protein
MGVQGLSSAISSALSAHGSTNINLGAGEQAVTEVLRNTINIQPTIVKHRGDQVAILLMQDINFAGVYSAHLTGGR